MVLTHRKKNNGTNHFFTGITYLLSCSSLSVLYSTVKSVCTISVGFEWLTSSSSFSFLLQPKYSLVCWYQQYIKLYALKYTNKSSISTTQQLKYKYNSNHTSSPTPARNKSLKAVNKLKPSRAWASYFTRNNLIELLKDLIICRLTYL